MVCVHIIHILYQELSTYCRPQQVEADRPDEAVPIHRANILVLGGQGVGKTAICQVNKFQGG